ncbi:diguanylate cyclase domain-containing protein [Pontibacter sp. JAM-7]|uniref:diguanylate cyclase domain-containing protein n=1 Tax=Pontibacter sp. JAM-7 TaxID=3366581 RepID=UPI003AF4A705
MPTAAAISAALTMRGKVIFIVTMLLTLSFFVFFLGYLQAEAMNGVRAYVRGEGLWAKSQKDAVMSLYRYTVDAKPADYEAFKQHLLIPLGDRQARQALQQSPPDVVKAYDGFLKGGNHPQDITSLINVFRLFHNVSYMKQAIAIWTEADLIITELFRLGAEVDARIQQGDINRTDLIRRLEVINSQLHALETEFSQVLSEGARWIKWVTTLTMGCLMLLLVLGSVYLVRRFIAQLYDTELRLRRSERRYLSLYESGMLGIVEWELSGRILDANTAALELLGYSKDQLTAKTFNWAELTPANFQEQDEQAIEQILKNGYCVPYSKELLHKGGRRVPVMVGGAMLEGSQDRGLAFVLDQTSQRAVEDQLRLSATVLEGSRDGILIASRAGVVLSLNQSYLSMTGYSEDDVKGRFARLFSPDTPDLMRQVMMKAILEQGHWQGDTEIKLADDSMLPVRLSMTAVYDNQHNMTHFVAIFTDISQRKAQERLLHAMALHDPLTGLANRSLFEDRLGHAIARAKRNNSQCAVLFIDLDKFKPINDQFGHHAGDELLLQVADRLRLEMRENDSIVRLGGDEFVVIVEAAEDKLSVRNVAEKILQRLDRPYELSCGPVHITCSMGIGMYPVDGTDTASLTRSADSAMYLAKSVPGSYYRFYSPLAAK